MMIAAREGVGIGEGGRRAVERERGVDRAQLVAPIEYSFTP